MVVGCATCAGLLLLPLSTVHWHSSPRLSAHCCSDAEAYHSRLRSAGVPSTHTCFTGLIHGFAYMRGEERGEGGSQGISGIFYGPHSRAPL